MRIARHMDRSLPALEPDVELVVYRVAQEALTNVARHGNCNQAELELRGLVGAVQLNVADAGAGFDADEAPEGAGIRGMRERALLVRASLDVTSAPGAGTTVRLLVPVQTAAGTSS